MSENSILIQRNFDPLVCYLAEYAHYDLNTNKRHTYKIIKCADKWLSTILGIWLAFSACFEIYYMQNMKLLSSSSHIFVFWFLVPKYQLLSLLISIKKICILPDLFRGKDKVRTFWKGHKNLKQSPTWFDIY